MNRKERNEYARKYRVEHKDSGFLKNRKWYMRDYYANHKDEIKARNKADRNKCGIMKSQIRVRSRRILKRSHVILPNYEIHHCFGYEDPSQFIYIPRELHLAIHQRLRDSNYSPSAPHWDLIKELITNSNEYTYIRH